MRIGYFAAMSGLRAGGPESYDTSLARALVSGDRDTQYTIYCVTDAAIESFGISQANVRFRTLRPASRWISIPVSLPLELLRRPVDVFHATYVPPPLWSGRLVFTLLDVSMFSHPDLYPPAIRFRLQVLIRSAMRRAQRILTISEFSRQMALDHLGCDPDRIDVAPLGVDPRFRPLADDEREATLRKYGISQPFILHVGRLQRRKNLIRLLAAFQRLRLQERIPHQLVLVGRESWDTREILAARDRMGLREHVVHVGYGAAEDLPAFYGGADLVVFPSLYEGFGLPVLEAMACGVPVVTSRVTSLPEVAGDAALLVDPTCVDAIAEGMHAVLGSSDLRAELRRRGLARARSFTWERTAALTRATYWKVLQDSR